MPARSRRTSFLIGATVAAAAIVSASLAREVAANETGAFDRRVLEAIHAESSPGLITVARSFTDLGSPAGITIVVALAAVFLSLRRRRATAVVFVVATAATALLDSALKEIFERARPHLWPRPPVSGDSFPSGHAVESVVVYGTLAVLLSAEYPRQRLLFGVIAALLVLAISSSRAILGVHWPTDLIAGLAIGTLALAATVSAISRWGTLDLNGELNPSESAP